ncbi:MarR family transcriptional regulator [Skermania sp. ID1734]|uniref:MarR family winged helix-turn-helix transcriptional regulator n=1 Tax=Skermania sp. ID1734 TaxID=2597516 RepID=UPI00117FD965|nr:MarR family transcriptional regulator [Skermania sp. ID1734]TSD95589.1 MarR family transcriptional regulator [Skermania sp. ID1734]
MHDPSEYTDKIGLHLVRLQRIRDRTLSQLSTMTKGVVDPAAYACLFRLLAEGPMRSGALAEAMYADPSTMSRQVAQLVERGLVERRADPGDGRASVLAVTEVGREMAAHLRQLRNARLDRILSDWTDDERRDFARLLGKFVTDYECRRPEVIAAADEVKGKK